MQTPTRCTCCSHDDREQEAAELVAAAHVTDCHGISIDHAGQRFERGRLAHHRKQPIHRQSMQWRAACGRTGHVDGGTSKELELESVVGST